MKLHMAVFLGLLLSGCATMTESYWQQRWDQLPEKTKREFYESLSSPDFDAERRVAETLLGAEITIRESAQTNSTLICFDGECVVVQVY